MTNFAQTSLRYCSAFSLLLQIVTAASNGTSIPLTATGFGKFYHFGVQIGGQTVPLVADTGSADLWVLGPNWKCYLGEPALNGTSVPQQNCSLGTQTYTPSSTFRPNDAAWLGEHYGSGDVVGAVGYDDIQFGEISISQQEFSVVNATSIYGTEGPSGIFGLAYPVLGQLHPANYIADSIEGYYNDRILYPTVMTRLLEMNITSFSMALERMPLAQESGFGGYLSFGSLPQVSYGSFVTVPVQIDDNVPSILSNGTQQISYWALSVKAVAWGNTTNTTSFLAVIDSGNQINFVPGEVAIGIAQAFDPPGTLDNDTDYYTVRCDAKPPANVSMKIGDYSFVIDSEDMIWRDDSGTCYSSLAPATPFLGLTSPILGAAFLKNVVAVFDYGNNTMSLAPRVSNSSSGSSSSSAAGLLKPELDSLTLPLAAAALLAALI